MSSSSLDCVVDVGGEGEFEGFGVGWFSAGSFSFSAIVGPHDLIDGTRNQVLEAGRSNGTFDLCPEGGLRLVVRLKQVGAASF